MKAGEGAVKTVRFSEVVKHSGKPEAYVLWTTPGRDPEFKRAVEKNRVMTVHQENRGGKKDYGVVGFTKDPHAELLIFPKSLQRFAGKRTVGLRYDLLVESLKSNSVRPERPGRKVEKFPVFRSSPKADAKEEQKRPDKPEPPARGTTPITISPKAKKNAQSELATEVRRALVELKKGKSVAAYQRLEKALARENEGKRVRS